ncbi:MAG: ExbD/TolR family protein [Bacteriovoracia bacterium]
MAAVKQEQEEISDINIVPLVDIILVVLIIFMVASPASQQSKIKVDIPQASSGDATGGGEPFQVTVNEEGYLFVSGEPVSENELKARGELEIKKNSQVEAILTADKNLDYGSVVKVIDLIKTTGIQKIAISTTSGLEE